MGIVQQIKRGLDKRRRHEADIEHQPYLRPEGSDGLHWVKDPYDGTERVVASSLSGKTFKPGTIVMLGSHTGFPGQSIIGPPPPGRRGSSGFAIDAPTPGELGMLGITSAAPSTVEAGASAEPVVLTGFGFKGGDTFEAVVFNDSTGAWSADPLVTVATVSVPDSETANVTVTVGSGAPAGRTISFRVRSTVGADLMAITESFGVTYWGVFYDSGASTLYLQSYSGGSYQSTLQTKVQSFASNPTRSFLRSGNNIVFQAGDLLVTWDTNANTITTYDTTAVLSFGIGHYIISGSSILFTETGFDAPKNLYSVPIGSAGPASVLHTLDDPGDGDFWLFGTQILPVGSDLFGVAWNLDIDEYWWSKWDTGTGKFAIIGSDADSEYIAFNVGWGFPGGLGFVVGFPGQSVAQEVHIILITPVGGWSQVLPSGWDLDGQNAFPSKGPSLYTIYPTGPSLDSLVTFDPSSPPASPTLVAVESAPDSGSRPSEMIPLS